MSINPDHQPKIPETMEYTSDERQVARNAADRLKGRQAKKNKLGHGGMAAVGLAITGLAVGAVVGANKLGIIGGNNTEPKQEANSSATANPNTKDETKEKSVGQMEDELAALSSQTSAEQVQWVIDHPVVASDYSSAEAMLDAFSARINAMDNSARLDYNKPTGENGHTPFTDSFQPKFDAMFSSIFDQSSDGFYTLYNASETVTQNTGEYLGNAVDIRNFITPEQGSGSIEGKKAEVIGTINTVSKSNSTDFPGDDGTKVKFNITISDNGVAKISHTNEIS